jgi:hypothetical protein
LIAFGLGWSHVTVTTMSVNVAVSSIGDPGQKTPAFVMVTGPAKVPAGEHPVEPTSCF